LKGKRRELNLSGWSENCDASWRELKVQRKEGQFYEEGHPTRKGRMCGKSSGKVVRTVNQIISKKPRTKVIKGSKKNQKKINFITIDNKLERERKIKLSAIWSLKEENEGGGAWKIALRRLGQKLERAANLTKEQKPADKPTPEGKKDRVEFFLGPGQGKY